MIEGPAIQPRPGPMPRLPWTAASFN